jgi:hypothetical protein
MGEVNPVKFYLARYFFLALSALQGLASALMLLQFGDSPKARFVAFALFTLALILFSTAPVMVQADQACSHQQKEN